MKKVLAVLTGLSLLVACGAAVGETTAPQTELVVFAAASMTEAMNQVAENYKAVAPNVMLVYNFDSSGTLQTQIEEGAEADVFISAGQKQMNALDIAASAEANPKGQDYILQGTRFDLLTNTIVLIVPEGSDRGIASFTDVATDKVSLIALGNSDVPVGQYAQDVFTVLGLWDQLISESKITFASNVKEVLAQVESAAVDCGVVYISDAVTGTGITVVATAPEGSHKPANYPAAVLKGTKNEQAAKDFLEYLKSDECAKVFTDIGFAVPER
ncbi:MAG: molybdate ABC transporter substrate-binding protein [Eubacteriales bacterium]|nr:molybdate ABC transporter substrate-binding protein [Eubacteriales bacterium]